MIDYLTYAFTKDVKPFLTLSSLSDQDAIIKMKELYIEGSILWNRFKNPEQYLQMRKQLEYWLRQEFIAKGGIAKYEYPIYAFWARPLWIQNLDTKTKETLREICIPLSEFSETDISFTYPDSMVSFLLRGQSGAQYYFSGFTGVVFTLSEMRDIVSKDGTPGEKWGKELPSHLGNYIEAQIWNHDLLKAYKDKYVEIQ